MLFIQQTTQRCPNITTHTPPTSTHQSTIKAQIVCTVSHPETPHLLVGSDVLHHHNITTNALATWTDWDGSLTSATNHNITTSFFSNLLHITSLLHFALLISQYNINAGGLGIIDPQTQVRPYLALTLATSL